MAFGNNSVVDKSKTQKMRTTKKLAIFFASIPTDKSIEIMKHFKLSTLEALTAEIRSLGTIDTSIQEAVFAEISERVSKGVAHNSGGDEVAKAILSGVVGEEEASRMLERSKPKRPKPFSSITGVSAQDLATILSHEQPATVAIVLSFFPPKKSGEILAFLEEGVRDEIVIRLAKDRVADMDIVERIERMLVEKVSSSINTSEEEERSNLGGPEFVAELFQGVDKSLEEELMVSLQEDSVELANQIRDLMFTFEDLIKLGDQDIQKVLREVSSPQLVVALRGADPEVTDKIMRNLSKRARENLEEEMELTGKLKKSEVEAERKGIVGIVRNLEASGEIQLSAAEEEDVYV
ncbi:MAG: flagellar motor switch protein FliG [Victivallales bacterium]|nr:flagellar motor switch protein FliG [Victivallales bacterium]